MSNFGDNTSVMFTPSANMGVMATPTPPMGPPVFSDDHTGFSVEQQNELTERLNNQGLLLDKIGDIQVPWPFALLWRPVTRAKELQPGYDSRTDLVYLLSRFPPAPWRLIFEELNQKWQRQEEAAYWALQQAQMGHEQQLAAGWQQVPYAHPQQDEMGGQSAQMHAQYSEARNLEETVAAAHRVAEQRRQDDMAMERVDSGVDTLGRNNVSGLEETLGSDANIDPALLDLGYGR